MNKIIGYFKVPMMNKLILFLGSLLLFSCDQEEFDFSRRYTDIDPKCPKIERAYYMNACLDKIILEVKNKTSACEDAHVVSLMGFEDTSPTVIKDTIPERPNIIEVKSDLNQVIVEVNPQKLYTQVHLDFLHSCKGEVPIVASDYENIESVCPTIERAYYKDACLEEIIIETIATNCENRHKVTLIKSDGTRDTIIDTNSPNVIVAGNKVIVKVDPSIKYKWIWLDFLTPCRGNSPIQIDDFSRITPQFQVINADTIPKNLREIVPTGLAINRTNRENPHLYFTGSGTRKIYEYKNLVLNHISGNDTSQTYNTRSTSIGLGNFDRPTNLMIQDDNLFIIENSTSSGRVIRRINNFRIIHNFIGNRVVNQPAITPIVPISSCEISLDDPKYLATNATTLFFSDETYKQVFMAVIPQNGGDARCTFMFNDTPFQNNEVEVDTVFDYSPRILRGLATSSTGELYALFESGSISEVLHIPSGNVVIQISSSVATFNDGFNDLLITDDDTAFFTTDQNKIGYFSLHDSTPEISFLKKSCLSEDFELSAIPINLAFFQNDTQKILYISTTQNKIEYLNLQ